MKKVIKTIINISLSPFGLSLASINEQNVPLEEYGKLLQKYKVLIKEVHGCFSELIFSDFLPCEDRFDLIAKLVGTPVSESLYVVAYLQKSLHLDGDVCEFGVAQGATSALLANEIHKTEKRMWLFDSFKGLGKPSDKDLLMDDIFNLGSIDKYEGTMACQVDEVKSRLKAISFPLSRAKIVAGFIEETINYVNLPEKVCFAYVDFDFYKPILIALRYNAPQKLDHPIS